MIRNSFTKKKIGTLTLGEKLRKLRGEKRLPLAEVSRITKIQIKYLEYLEEGLYEKLPADVYVRGFLRSYGEFLGVEDRVLIKLYEKEKEIKNNIEKEKNFGKKEDKIKPINISSFVFTPRKIIAAISIVVVMFGAVYLYKEIGSFTDSPRLILLSPQDGLEISSNSVDVFGTTDRDARLFINDQPILVNDEGKFKESITLQAGANTINIKAINRFDKDIQKQITINSNTGEIASREQASSSEEQSYETAGEESEMSMDLRVDPGPVWVSVEADDNLVFSGTMLSGSVQSFKANDKIMINSGKANATYVKFNGKDIGTLGPDPGAVKGVTFTKDTKY